MKNEYRSEPYDLYGERGTQDLNMKIEVISYFSNTVLPETPEPGTIIHSCL